MSPDSDIDRGFRLADITVLPSRGEILAPGGQRHVEPKAMDVLVCLARHATDVVGKQQLVDAAWGGRAVTDEVITRTVSTLRSHLGDDARTPRFIETIPRRGYRLLVRPEPLDEPRDTPSAAIRRRPRTLLIAGLAAAAAIGGWLLFDRDAPPSIADLDSIAVLPFDNMSAEDMQYLADGVTEELTYALSQVPGLKVAARTTAFQFRDSALDVRDIGRLIEVDGVIEGSVRREGDRLRVTAQLIDARSGFHLWADSYDGSVDDVFRLQRQVAARVRSSLRGQAEAAEPTAPTSFAAYDNFLRGRYQLHLRGEQALQRAATRFREVIAADPGYGPAYLELAHTLLLLPSYTDAAAEPLYEEALRVIDRGVQEDASIAASAAAVHGYIQNKRGHWQDADRHFREALAAPQVSSTTHQWYSNMLASVGRLEAALAEAENARRLDPLSPVVVSRLAMTHLWLDDHVAAARHFAAANELGIRSALHTESQLLLLIREARFTEARERARVQGEVPAWLDHLLTCLDQTAGCDTARTTLVSANIPTRVKLVAAAMLEDHEQVDAIAALLAEDISAFETELLFIRELAGWRTRPAFTELMDSSGIAAYWQAAGCRFLDDRVRCEPPAR